MSRDPHRPLVLGRVFHFYRFSRADAEAYIKSQVTLRDVCSIPGSTILRSRILQSILRDNVELLREGLLRPDLRSSYNSFVDYLRDNGGDADDQTLAFAEFLDSVCQHKLRFDAATNSDKFKSTIVTYLFDLHTNTGDERKKRLLDQAIEKLEHVTGIFSHESAKKLSDDPWLAGKIGAMADYSYLMCGADHLNSNVEVPFATLEQLSDFVPLDSISRADLTPHFHDQIIGISGLDRSIFASLTAGDIIDLKCELDMGRFVSEIETHIDALSQSLASKRENAQVQYYKVEELRREMDEAILQKVKRDAWARNRAKLSQKVARVVLGQAVNGLDAALEFIPSKLKLSAKAMLHKLGLGRFQVGSASLYTEAVFRKRQQQHARDYKRKL